MKKFWAILLAMMLVLSMVTVAGATEVENPSTDAEGFTITVNPKDDVDHEYQVYQIFTADVETNAGEKVLTSVKWGTNAKNDTDAVRTGDPVPDAFRARIRKSWLKSRSTGMLTPLRLIRSLPPKQPPARARS